MNHTEQEQQNIEVIKEFILIAHDPKRASAQAVRHLCVPNSRLFAPTTFPGIHTVEQFAEDHGNLMKQINDLRIANFDVCFAKENRVCLRYSAEGSHSGLPHGAILPSGRRAYWSAAALFRLENCKIAELIINWNKLSMWEQLGWPPEECLVYTEKRQPESQFRKAA
jgi:SnoaL-like polyketide cyclase